ncbi:MAG: hypothetical protein KJ950_04665 [Proteobacteria bacterium]|nr:hypothetical protein [Pseudomonadota bacterium]MBU1688560.1 hypothetical protein [Pseudomonadota bacterium]
MKKLAYRSGLFPFMLGTILMTSTFVLAEQGSVLERIQAADQPFKPLQIESAHELTSTTVIAQESYQGGSFRVLARKEFIGRFRCSVCHSDKPMLGQDGVLFTHGDITINHGQKGASLICSDCHHDTERDFLSDTQGRKIDFDHSYQLCGQCHFRQKRDWVGGAHGKRESFWAGERVVKNCTSCHNPHAPAFAKKMPETYSLPLAE